MSLEDITVAIKQVHIKPMDELEAIKKILHRKYTKVGYLDTSKPFVYWKQLEAIVTREIVRRKLVIRNLKKQM